MATEKPITMEEGNKECQMLDSRAKLAVFGHQNDTKISRKYPLTGLRIDLRKDVDQVIL